MSTFKIAAVGDISFEGRNADHPDASVFAAVAPWLEKADLSVGNLENPLIDGGAPVPGKCTLHGHTGWAQVLKQSGFTVMSLANNHMMDYGPDGLASTLRALKAAGVMSVGAGMNADEALAPLILEVNQHKVAFFARSSVEVASRCYATGSQCGVAFLDLAQTTAAVSEIKKTVDYVILIVHWGLEEYAYPAPKQRKEAAALIAAGVDCILGHHPHVLQGYESLNAKLVIYSFGNFLFDEFDWNYHGPTGQVVHLHATLGAENKTGLLLAIEFENQAVSISEHVFTAIGNDPLNRITVASDDPARFARLNKPFTLPLYSYFWKMYSLKKEWDLRLSRQFSLKANLKKLHKLRLSHIRDLFKTILKAVRIASGKTTNPYD